MKYIKGFDGLRAVSIIFVLLTHLGLSRFFADGTFLKTNYNLISGSTGVMIFFTISGFLITLLLLNEKNTFQKIHIKHFFIRRFLRLLPPLLLFYSIVFGLMLFGYLPENYIALGISFFYLYNFVPLKYYVSELGHTWSLAMEEQFYLIWPFLLRFIKKIKSVVYIIIALSALCILVKVFYRDPIILSGKTYFLFDYFFPNRWFIPACLPIMLGALSAILLFKKKVFIKNIFFNKKWPLAFALVLFCMQLCIAYKPFILIETAQPIAVCVFLLWIYFNQQSKIVSVLEYKPIAFIGKISYGLYVYQGLFLRTGPGGSLEIQKFPLNIILVFVVAIISYYFVEKPILQLKRRFKPH
ncbi:acyltransferase family protein [Lacinutrix gracilariae]|uniref:Acyltransferase family protein n=1 Tax=Lacinutrix gracilariae TaxID=1747198 RepID=A0ABW5JZV3_9FLAO